MIASDRLRRSRLPRPVPLVLLLTQAWAAGAVAQTGSQSLSAGIETRLGYYDFLGDTRVGRQGTEWIGEITPTLSLQSRSGRIIGSLDYGLTLRRRSGLEPSSEAVNRLDSRFSAEAVPRHLFLEGQASIAEQATSPFGQQSPADSGSGNRNRAEVGTASFSPVLRGVIGGAVTAEARLNVAALNTRDSLVGDNLQTGGSLSLSSLVSGTLFSWGLTAHGTETDYRIGRTTRVDSTTATLGWQADADLSLTLRGGSETQNVQELESQRTNTWGVGASWRPSPRTRLQLNLDDRYFGRGYGAVAEYRLPRTTFSWTSGRDTTSGLGGSIEPQTQFQQLMALLATDIPDVTAREAAVRELLATLGLDPASVARPGFVISSASVVERHALSWAWAGQRLNFGVQGYRTVTTAIDTALSAVAREPLRQNGYSANAAYKLTPTSSLVGNGSRLMTKATPTQPGTDLKSVSLSWTEQLGRRTNVSLSARYTVFNSAIDPYREAALTAALLSRF
ncbi:MAG: TIGR03016 family PEP-CTERM system-associated outer membrane protein [Rubrivivax sp.]